jgi:DNA-binding transcriptional regulator LsrR (DeoR family)
MKLMANQAGAWRKVVEYPLDRDAEVRQHAAQLALAAGHCWLRILDPGDEVAATWSPSVRVWVEYPFRRPA